MGVNGRLLARGTTSLNLKGEAALARLDIVGDGALVEAMAVNMRRLRLSTEASRELVFASGGSLIPWGELGVRHDGDPDEHTGAGADIAQSVQPRSGLFGERHRARGWTRAAVAAPRLRRPPPRARGDEPVHAQTPLSNAPDAPHGRGSPAEESVHAPAGKIAPRARGSS